MREVPRRGADEYIQKPFNIEIVKLRIIKLLEERNRLREVFLKESQSPAGLSIETKGKVESLDDLFMRKFIALIEENYSDPDFSIEKGSEKLGLSRVHLYRKVKELSGITPTDFLRNYRLKKASALLKQRSGTISDRIIRRLPDGRASGREVRIGYLFRGILLLPSFLPVLYWSGSRVKVLLSC